MTGKKKTGNKIGNKTRKTLAVVLLPPFLALTAYAVWEVGFVGIFAYQLESPAGWQVFVDLVIALVLVLTWLVADARRESRNPWPWVVATFAVGVISPLLYFATSKGSDEIEAT